MSSQRHYEIRRIPGLDGCAVEWVLPDRLIISRGNALYCSDEDGASRRLIGHVPRPAKARALASVRLGRRLLRELFYNVIPLGARGVFVTFAREIGIVRDGKFQPASGLRRPTRVLRGGCALAADGSIYFGEYFDNADRGEMYVYRFDPDTCVAEVVHVFARGEIYHVHAVRRDVDDSLLCLTGDRGAECRFLRTNDGFKTLTPIGMGDESWRFVSVVPRERDWLVATDAEFRENAIFSLDRFSGARTLIGPVDGPVYYAARVGDTVFFGSTAERCVIQPNPKATLYAVHGTQVEAVRTFDKDISNARWAWKLFLPGTLHFPGNGGVGSTLFVSGVALSGFDARVLRVDWTT